MTTYIIIGVIALLAIILCATGYVKAPPDQAYIISGPHKRPRTVIGKSSIKIPILDRLDKVTLQLMQVDVKTTSAVPTAEYINVNVDAVANIKISSNPEMLALATQNFLNKDTKYIVSVAQEVLEGNMREIVGMMKLEDMVSDRKAFSENVLENAVPDLAAMGLEIVSFNIQNFSDNNNVIEDLGIDNISKIKKNAAIVKAESDRDIAIARAKANQEANDARIASETQVATRNNELDIKKSELKVQADIKRADADAAYEIQQQSQRKNIEIATVDADIAKQEREVVLKTQEASVREQSLNAQVKKQAEADKYAAQQKSDAELYTRQKQADAKKYEQEQNALAQKAVADTKRYEQEQEAEAVKVKGLAEAEAIRVKGIAEAEAIKAKGLAEAEAIEKKAEAMTKMGQASILEMYFNALPDVVKGVATPLASVDKITMYGDGNNTKLIKDVVSSATQVMDSIQESTGVDIKSVIAGFLANSALNSSNTQVTE